MDKDNNSLTEKQKRGIEALLAEFAAKNPNVTINPVNRKQHRSERVKK